MSDPTEFIGSLYRVAVDKEGEATVVLKIPASDLPSVLRLFQHLEQALYFQVREHV
ncbi:MAG: hypothetical protein NPIRA02_10820 [Nitrospirales bacterium]|nr:MAG: hypothetical protein NPIRA02_10820 [Nitrospirales bacterium]